MKDNIYAQERKVSLSAARLRNLSTDLENKHKEIPWGAGTAISGIFAVIFCIDSQ